MNVQEGTEDKHTEDVNDAIEQQARIVRERFVAMQEDALTMAANVADATGVTVAADATDTPCATTSESDMEERDDDVTGSQFIQEDMQNIYAEQERRVRRMRYRSHIADMFDFISYWGYILSWVFLALFIIGRFVPYQIVSFAGVLGSLVSIAASMVASETADRLVGERTVSKMAKSIVISAGAVVFCGMGLYGLATNDVNWSSGGVIGLFLWSWMPSLVDFVKNQERQYKTYEYDENGNVIDDGSDDIDEGYRYVSHSSGGYSSGGFSVINEVFGIPQPQDPPPIEISRDDIYDEPDDHLRVVVRMEDGTIEDVVIESDMPEAVQENADAKDKDSIGDDHDGNTLETNIDETSNKG